MNKHNNTVLYRNNSFTIQNSSKPKYYYRYPRKSIRVNIKIVTSNKLFD